jgi:hypothetical protein
MEHKNLFLISVLLYEDSFPIWIGVGKGYCKPWERSPHKLFKGDPADCPFNRFSEQW